MWTVQQKLILSLGKDLKAHGESAAGSFYEDSTAFGGLSKIITISFLSKGRADLKYTMIINSSLCNS